ncbi:hypothetical protein COX28_01120 [Candidatus Kuenenbacteria bacterium CG23_combo_of_CG06-09_8_20_14_all_39_39]|nr:MAG: hypothetical protein COX28_01120 [Candidatus Kuenenbacteria bacterium CG23_combo_of_CG06-09_8_20_14_all_39_39]
MANINEFVGCNAQRSVAASSYLVYLTLSIRGDYKEVYGVVASPTQDTIDKINKTKKTISAYDSKVRDIFKDRYDMASDEWRVNYEKLKSGW